MRQNLLRGLYSYIRIFLLFVSAMTFMVLNVCVPLCRWPIRTGPTQGGYAISGIRFDAWGVMRHIGMDSWSISIHIYVALLYSMSLVFCRGWKRQRSCIKGETQPTWRGSERNKLTTLIRIHVNVSCCGCRTNNHCFFNNYFGTGDGFLP